MNTLSENEIDLAKTPDVNLPSGSNPVSRYKAAAIHLGLSALVAVVLVALMLTLWYPSPYFAAMGGGKLLFLIVSIDIVVGPIITLIIFNPKKKSLKMDLFVVACNLLRLFMGLL
jgi:hypothetical protein